VSRRLERWRAARRARKYATAALDLPAAPSAEPEPSPVDIAPDDPALAHFQRAGATIDLDEVSFDSPAVRDLKAAGVKLVVPLVAQGELIGLINLGPRLSEQEYTSDDRKLLENLAGQAAPALRIAQLVREQEAEATERERIAQELRVATLIQQNFLPRRLPEPDGWDVAAYYRPAREVGGDFYDFVQLSDGRLSVFTGDVTDKGVPAALVMAATRAILRATAQRLDKPGEVLARVNEQLQPDIPSRMFVTCLYGVLDLETGRFVFANAGHNLPCVGRRDGAIESRATGVPLGMLAGQTYEEAEVTLEPGETLLLYSDALPEAHNANREMYGFPRLLGQVGKGPRGARLIDHLLDDLRGFTGEDWEQEDDITLVVLHRADAVTPTNFADPGSTKLRGSWFHETRGGPAPPGGQQAADRLRRARNHGGRRLLAEFTVSSRPGNERQAVEQVEAAIVGIPLDVARLERLRTAVAETTMNAIEHGNANRPELYVEVEVYADPSALLVRVSDHGGGPGELSTETPDIAAKLRGEQKPRGWGLFLIRNMVDDVHVTATDDRHTVELVMALKGDDDDLPS
jgi:serine phosphatase RsbU (regulator of sigma subunit)/anti-sigma regulatory factor (Ser/Thr protein kinase)